ncbi:hypothetical protein NKH89_34645 [Mesorhizobium sp. M0923]|uniref:hypothetical protein n=1 Tax=Mesorhizobium sp. M0923 TaxID=2957028 RepID=UPI0033361E4F
MRAFLGWLRGERRHCSMAEIPTVGDARRPNRERDSLVRERTPIVSRIKAILARFGIRAFKPILRDAKQLEYLRTVEGTLLPENTRGELSRNFTRSGCYTNRFARSNASACAGFPQLPRYLRRSKGRMRWFVCSRGSSELASRRQTCWSMRFCGASYAIEERSPGTRVSPGRRRERQTPARERARTGRQCARSYGMILLAWRFLQYQ